MGVAGVRVVNTGGGVVAMICVMVGMVSSNMECANIPLFWSPEVPPDECFTVNFLAIVEQYLHSIAQCQGCF